MKLRFHSGDDLRAALSRPFWIGLPLLIRRKINDAVGFAQQHFTLNFDAKPMAVDPLFVKHLIPTAMANAPICFRSICGAEIPHIDRS